MRCARGLSPGGAARVPAAGGAETHHSSLTQPRATVWEVRQRPETCLEGARRSACAHAPVSGSRLARSRAPGAMWPRGRACTSSCLSFLVTKAGLFVHSFIHSIRAYVSTY